MQLASLQAHVLAQKLLLRSVALRQKSTDKRGLILAGADRVMREMTAIFKDDPQFAEPIDNAMNAVWAKVYSEVSS